MILYIDMEIYNSVNHPLANFVAALYNEFNKHLINNYNASSIELQRKLEEQFKISCEVVQAITYEHSTWGICGEAENPFEILKRNSLVADVSNIIGTLILYIKDFLKDEDISIIFYELYEEKYMRLLRNIITPYIGKEKINIKNTK